MGQGREASCRALRGLLSPGYAQQELARDGLANAARAAGDHHVQRRARRRPEAPHAKAIERREQRAQRCARRRRHAVHRSRACARRARPQGALCGSALSASACLSRRLSLAASLARILVQTSRSVRRQQEAAGRQAEAPHRRASPSQRHFGVYCQATHTVVTLPKQLCNRVSRPLTHPTAAPPS